MLDRKNSNVLLMRVLIGKDIRTVAAAATLTFSLFGLFTIPILVLL
jgi:hypothetical protein